MRVHENSKNSLLRNVVNTSQAKNLEDPLNSDEVKFLCAYKYKNPNKIIEDSWKNFMPKLCFDW
jgi:hypothetical protein